MPRLKELIESLEELHHKIGEEGTTPENIDLSFDSFQRLIDKSLVLVSQAFSQKLVVPDFPDFCTHLKDIFRRCRSNTKVWIDIILILTILKPWYDLMFCNIIIYKHREKLRIIFHS